GADDPRPRRRHPAGARRRSRAGRPGHPGAVGRRHRPRRPRRALAGTPASALTRRRPAPAPAGAARRRRRRAGARRRPVRRLRPARAAGRRRWPAGRRHRLDRAVAGAGVLVGRGPSGPTGPLPGGDRRRPGLAARPARRAVVRGGVLLMGWHNPAVPWREFERRLSWRTTGTPLPTPAKEPKKEPADPTQGPSPVRAVAPWAELHCHTSFSFLDGCSTPRALVEEALRLG